MALLAECVEAGANDAEIFGAVECAKTAGYFLLYFGHADGAFANIMPTPGLCRAEGSGAHLSWLLWSVKRHNPYGLFRL